VHRASRSDFKDQATRRPASTKSWYETSVLKDIDCISVGHDCLAIRLLESVLEFDTLKLNLLTLTFQPRPVIERN
jgi:hypothetical protein